MSRRVSTYVPSDVSCIILGVELFGFDSDSFITITPIEDRITYRKTPDGKVTAFINRSQIFELEIRLSKTSPSNAFLQILFDTYLNYGQLFKMPIHISGGGVSGRFYAGDSFIKVETTSTHGSNPTANVWKFVCFNATMTESGSSVDDSMISEIAGAMGVAGEVMNLLGVNMGDVVGKISEVSGRTGITDKISTALGKLF